MRTGKRYYERRRRHACLSLAHGIDRGVARAERQEQRRAEVRGSVFERREAREVGARFRRVAVALRPGVVGGVFPDVGRRRVRHGRHGRGHEVVLHHARGRGRGGKPGVSRRRGRWRGRGRGRNGSRRKKKRGGFPGRLGSASGERVGVLRLRGCARRRGGRGRRGRTARAGVRVAARGELDADGLDASLRRRDRSARLSQPRARDDCVTRDASETFFAFG
mmetsp:Transcript_14516/g.61158  ORF Transcript_14516/g.61158 Transcript_14516/m.61158 type:complete len:221 (-) Transcript_14516:1857-2519(-)